MKLLLFASSILTIISCLNSQAQIVFENKQPKMTIVVAGNQTKAEETAAKELSDYLVKITKGQFKTVKESEFKGDGKALYVGWTERAKKAGIDYEKMGQEEWLIKTIDGDIIISGGRPRGTLYGVYHFLEDDLGVRWWTPYEEFVPSMDKISFTKLDRKGKPVFTYRDLYLVGPDTGTFSARNRLNTSNPNYGGQMLYGGTYGCHTLYPFFADTYKEVKDTMKKAYQEHPDWFPLIDGKRKFDSVRADGSAQTQLCLTNPELRKFFLERVRKLMKDDAEKAKKNGVQPPMFYAIDQNDCYDGFCKCDKCMEIVKKEGGNAGLMLDFTNYIATTLKDENPDTIFLMMAIHSTEPPPKFLKPAPNVGIRLCDTTSNMIYPWTHTDNAAHKKNVDEWAKVCDKITIWDYSIHYGDQFSGKNLPFPNTRTFAPDLRYLAEHNGIGLFFEHEEIIGADLRDLKIWLEPKLAENPYLDYDTLLKDFTGGFYGPAGKYIREYIALLEKSADAKKAKVTWFPSLGVYTYLDNEFMLQAMKIFDDAEQAVKNDPAILKRIQYARMSLDRAFILKIKSLKSQWATQGKDEKDFPYDIDKIVERYKNMWLEQCKIKKAPESDKKDLEKFLDGLSKRKALPTPEIFKDVTPEKLFDFNAHMFQKWIGFCKLAEDKESVVGAAHKIAIEDSIKDNREHYRPDAYGVPFKWSVHPTMKGTIHGKTDVKFPVKSGYNWYKTAENVQLTKETMFAWLSGSGVQLEGVVADNSELGQEYDIWISMKIDGPEFSNGVPGKDNVIWVDRVIVIQKTSNKDKKN